jgi:hypothetical protein
MTDHQLPGIADICNEHVNDAMSCERLDVRPKSTVHDAFLGFFRTSDHDIGSRGSREAVREPDPGSAKGGKIEPVSQRVEPI